MGWCVGGGSTKQKDTQKLDKLIKKATSVIGAEQDSVATVAEKRALDKLLAILGNSSHPLHELVMGQRSLFSERLRGLGSGGVEMSWGRADGPTPTLAF